MTNPRLVRAYQLLCPRCLRAQRKLADTHLHNLTFDEQVICGFCGLKYSAQTNCEGTAIPNTVAKLVRSLLQHGLFSLWHGVLEDGRTNYLHLERMEGVTCTATCRIEWSELDLKDRGRAGRTIYGSYKRWVIGCWVPDAIHNTATIFDQQSWFFTQAEGRGDNKNIRFEVCEPCGQKSTLRLRAQIDFGHSYHGEQVEVFIPVDDPNRAVALLTNAATPQDADLILFDDRARALAYWGRQGKKRKAATVYLLKLTCSFQSMNYAAALDAKAVRRPLSGRAPSAPGPGFPVGKHVREVWRSLKREQIVLEICDIAGK